MSITCGCPASRAGAAAPAASAAGCGRRRAAAHILCRGLCCRRGAPALGSGEADDELDSDTSEEPTSSVPDDGGDSRRRASQAAACRRLSTLPLRSHGGVRRRLFRHGWATASAAARPLAAWALALSRAPGSPSDELDATCDDSEASSTSRSLAASASESSSF